MATSSPMRPESDPGAKADGVAPVVLTPPKQLHSLGGLTGLVEQMRQRFGDTMGYHLLVDYRGGWGDGARPSAIDDDRLIDFSKIDMKAIVGMLRGAPQTLGIKPADVTNSYLILDPSKDPTAGDITVSIYVSSDFGSGLYRDQRRRRGQRDQLPVLTTRGSGRRAHMWRGIYRRDTMGRGVEAS